MIVPENEELKKYKVQNHNRTEILQYIFEERNSLGTAFNWSLAPGGHYAWNGFRGYETRTEEQKSYLQWLVKNSDKMEATDPTGQRWDYDRRPFEEDIVDTDDIEEDEWFGDEEFEDDDPF